MNNIFFALLISGDNGIFQLILSSPWGYEDENTILMKTKKQESLRHIEIKVEIKVDAEFQTNQKALIRVNLTILSIASKAK